MFSQIDSSWNELSLTQSSSLEPSELLSYAQPPYYELPPPPTYYLPEYWC